MSIQARDEAAADYRSAAARVDALEAALAQSREASGRSDQIKAQQAAVAAARAEVRRGALAGPDQRHLCAPTAGLVADTLAHAGETVGAGETVVSLLPPENRYIRFFVPEADLDRVHRGDRVQRVLG